MDLEKFHLVTRFASQAALYGDRDAIRHWENGQWCATSWRLFNQRVQQIAYALLHHQVDIQENIGIFAPNSPEWTMVDMAAAHLRACAVPIYATNTADQASYIINDANIRILFIGEKEQYEKIQQIKEKCPQLELIVVFNGALVKGILPFVNTLSQFTTIPNQEIYTEELKKRFSQRNLQDIYTIIYTSGTTGKPKGVLIDYENVAYQLINHDERLTVKEGNVSMSFLPLSHVYERLWLAYVLHKGVINCYLDDTNRVAEALKEVKPHYMCVVPRLLEKIYTKIYENVGKQSLIKRMIFSFATRTAKIHLKQKRKGKRVSFILQELYNFSDKLVFRKLKEALGGNIQMIPCGGALLEPSIGRFFRAIGVNVTLGYGMTETTATVACWDIKFKLKSVGTVLPNIEVKIGENNEILLKGGSITKGYYNNPEENVKAFTSDGYFRTGDAGYLDKEGNLFITERIKELMKTSNGKYIAPQQIEGKVGKDSFIEQIAIIADARKYVSALIVPNYDALVEYAKSLNLKYKNYSDLIKNSQIVDFFQKRLQNLQQGLAAYEQIKKFTLLTTPFSINNNELTPTLKLKRKNIYKNYFKEIEAMYV
ncbi:long-chain fatty acid--CoA ligase [Capnocytophaga sp. oral taxon 338]|uniref:AMP-dependent synthetase/ligase n=1 Tax=Capnocytophaga sp. oral taxon 338 TaxID=710239 RepID=UPI000202BA02|nr:long-chain fatty acid--CoA ligase [Capnocytophaga sp. oral taxon 338]EGD33450.1 long-chain-fatty-acid--CoA ligase [Capnocytophaga sp. oral taxon 338 str. F0234]